MLRFIFITFDMLVYSFTPKSLIIKFILISMARLDMKPQDPIYQLINKLDS